MNDKYNASKKTGQAALSDPHRRPQAVEPASSRDHGVGSIPLGLALTAAGPLIAAAAQAEGEASWRNLVEAARNSAPLLGLDQTAWGEACTRLGRGGAALAAIMIERGLARTPSGGVASTTLAPIRAPGAYLRGMLARAERGELRLDRSIRALAARHDTA